MRLLEPAGLGQAVLVPLMCEQFDLDARGVALTCHTTRDCTQGGQAAAVLGRYGEITIACVPKVLKMDVRYLHETGFRPSFCSHRPWPEHILDHTEVSA